MELKTMLLVDHLEDPAITGKRCEKGTSLNSKDLINSLQFRDASQDKGIQSDACFSIGEIMLADRGAKFIQDVEPMTPITIDMVEGVKRRSPEEIEALRENLRKSEWKKMLWRQKKVYCSECGAEMISVSDTNFALAKSMWSKLRGAKSSGGRCAELVLEKTPDRVKLIGSHQFTDHDQVARDYMRLCTKYKVEPDEYKGMTSTYVNAPWELPTATSMTIDPVGNHLEVRLKGFDVASKIVVKRGDAGICPACGKQASFGGPEALYEKNADELIESVRSKEYQSTAYNGTSNKTVDIKEYLENLINISINIRTLEGELKKLCRAKGDPNEELGYQFKVKEMWKKEECQELLQRKNEIERLIKQLENTMREDSVKLTKNDIAQIINNAGIKLPEQPHPPTPKKIINISEDDLRKPEVPIMKTPGLFNKKKVEQENAAAQKQYDEHLERYNKAIADKSLNDIEEKRFDEEQSKYLLLKAQYEYDMETVHSLIDPIIAEKEKELTEKKNAKEAEKLNQRKTELVQITESLKKGEGLEKYENIKLETGFSYAAIKAKNEIIDADINEITKLLENQYSCLNSLLAPEIIFPKYNDLVAWTTFYEYFVTGRVEGLAGPNGAYNLYESELRSNIIISKMDVIISQLESIRDNQYVLFKSIQDVNRNIEGMSGKLNDLINVAMDSNQQLRQIKDTAQYINYNTERTAQYAKITATTNTAMMFMKAIWG